MKNTILVFGRKMAAFLLGALGGGSGAQSYNLARQHLMQPFEEDIQDWQREGKNISTRANLMEKERARQLSSLKFALQQRASQRRNEDSKRARAEAERRRIAAEISDEAERKEREEHRREIQHQVMDMRSENAEFSRQMREDSAARAAESATRAQRIS
jgi:hypothetical protein